MRVLDRRAFLLSSGLSLLATPLVGGAQQTGKVRRVGIVCPVRNPRTDRVFEERLREFGYVAGRDIVFEYRCPGGTAEQLQAAARDLVALPVDVLVAAGTASATAAKTATSTIPIVFNWAADPVALGFAVTLARPGGNMTGTTADAGLETPGKRLQILKEAVPTLSRVAVLHAGADSAVGPHLESISRVAHSLGVRVDDVAFTRPEELAAAFSRIRALGAQGLVVVPGGLTSSNLTTIADLALSRRLPSVYGLRNALVAGGLLSLDSNPDDQVSRTAVYVDKILKGAQPGDLPVEQPTMFELIINMKTAKALGITIPPSVLGRADEVIE